MKIGIASDHGAFRKKEKIKKYLTKKGHEVIDYGTTNTDVTDYPTYIIPMSESVAKEELDLGIAMCTTGIGASIAANKVKGIRAAKLNSINDAKMAKRHNDANVLAFAGKTSSFLIKDMIDTFIKEKTDTKERYQNRNDIIKKYEVKND